MGVVEEEEEGLKVAAGGGSALESGGDRLPVMDLECMEMGMGKAKKKRESRAEEEGSQSKANKEWLQQHSPGSPLLSHPLQLSLSTTNPQLQKQLFLSPILVFFLLTLSLYLQDGRLLPCPNHPNPKP